MKRTLLIIYSLLCGCFCPLMADDADALRYQDSILQVADALPATLARLTYLRDMAYKHQYAPYNMTFSTRLYEEAKQQENVFYENLGAYYLASCYDKKHDADSLAYWVDILKEFVPQVGTYDYYLEQKAAVSRALASKRQIEKAVYVAKETLEEAVRHRSNNGKIAACNSLGCAYGVSSRPKEALDTFLEAYKSFSPQTKASLKIDILSRIAQVYGNSGRDSLRLPYLLEMDSTLQEVISREPETRKNWTNFEIDCQIKYILHYFSVDLDKAHGHIEVAKKLYGPHVDPVFWLNIQLIQLQYYNRTDEPDKSIAPIDEVTSTVLNNYVSTFATLITYKANIQYGQGDIDGAIESLRYLIQTQDSLNNAFSASQLQQVKEIYHIDELLLEKQKIQDTNYHRGVLFLAIILLLALLFYLYTHYLSRKIAVVEKHTAEAALQAETDNIAKDRLKSEISHDIRTPLNVVVGFAELLTGTEDLDKDTKKEYERIIQANAESLLSYVNSILELSRLESGKTKYEQEVCDVLHLCHKAMLVINEQENSSVSVTLQTEIDRQEIQTDKKWFETLLTSMLMPLENDSECYRAVIRIKRDMAKSVLCFDVIDAPLARAHFENKTSLIRHEINAHFIHYFGGIYKVQAEAEEGPTISFTIPY
ncbi:MAG: HAMP domain-containing histidine kinase [Bacteroides sp.]|nr:HAMP domain-containing histidine kinase [Bacteroides sp.]